MERTIAHCDKCCERNSCIRTLQTEVSTEAGIYSMRGVGLLLIYMGGRMKHQHPPDWSETQNFGLYPQHTRSFTCTWKIKKHCTRITQKVSKALTQNMFYNSLEPLTHMWLVKDTVKKTVFKRNYCSGGFAVEEGREIGLNSKYTRDNGDLWSRSKAGSVDGKPLRGNIKAWEFLLDQLDGTLAEARTGW